MFAKTGKLVLALLAAVWVTGCASTQSLTDADRKAVKAVKINQEVAKSTDLYLLAPGAAVGLMFGPLGGVATAIANEAPHKALQVYIEKSGISIEKIAREEIAAALKASGKFPVVEGQIANALPVKISIEQYGFSVPNLLSSSVVPVLYLKCELLNAEGKVIWSASDRLVPTAFTAVDSVSFEAMKNDPKIVEVAWRQAARIVAKNIAEEL